MQQNGNVGFKRQASRMGPLEVLLFGVLATYPFSFLTRFFRNLSVHDAVLTVLFIWLASSRIGKWKVSYLFSSGYGLGTSLMVAALAVATLFNAGDGLAAGIFAVQHAFIYLVFIPVVVVALNSKPNPLRIVGAFCWLYTIMYTVGFLAFSVAGVEILVADSGNRRFNPVWLGGYQLLVMHSAVSLTQYVQGQIKLVHLVGVMSIVAVLTLASGSRTSVVGIGIAVVYCLYVQYSRGALTVRTVGLLLAMGVTAFFGRGIYLSSTGGSLGKAEFSSRIVESFFEDESRRRLLTDATQVLSKGRTWMVGNGIGALTDGYGTRVHNAVVQMALETGILGVVGLLVLLIFPFRLPRSGCPNEVEVGRGILLAQFSFLMFSGLSTERAFSIPFAIGLGLILSPKLKTRSLC